MASGLMQSLHCVKVAQSSQMNQSPAHASSVVFPMHTASTQHAPVEGPFVLQLPAGSQLSSVLPFTITSTQPFQPPVKKSVKSAQFAPLSVDTHWRPRGLGILSHNGLGTIAGSPVQLSQWIDTKNGPSTQRLTATGSMVWIPPEPSTASMMFDDRKSSVPGPEQESPPVSGHSMPTEK